MWAPAPDVGQVFPRPMRDSGVTPAGRFASCRRSWLFSRGTVALSPPTSAYFDPNFVLPPLATAVVFEFAASNVG
jgi:hypothetical protein